MITFTNEFLRDKIYACWLGKNIGGTLGMPMEWNRQPNDVTYYTHKMTGEPLPNDDLDIQVLWLLALEDKGERVAILEARRHYAWYLKGVPHANYYKDQIVRMNTLEDVTRITEGIKRDLR